MIEELEKLENTLRHEISTHTPENIEPKEYIEFLKITRKWVSDIIEGMKAPDDMTVAYLSGKYDGNKLLKKLEAENKSIKEHVAMLVPVFVEQQDMKRWDKIACKLEHEKNCWKNLYHNKKDAFLAYQDKAEEVVEKFKLESLDNITKTRKLKEELKSLEETQNINFKEYGNKCIEVNNLKEEIKELKKSTLAELADEKEYHAIEVSPKLEAGDWIVRFYHNCTGTCKEFYGETYAETEAKAREFLEGLK